MRSKVDPERVREDRAAAAFRRYAIAKKLNKEWAHLDAESKEAWKQAGDEVAASLFAELEEEEVFITFLKLGMCDALKEDHISQLVTQFIAPGPLGISGKVRLIIAPDRISMPFAAPLRGKVD